MLVHFVHVQCHARWRLNASCFASGKTRDFPLLQILISYARELFYIDNCTPVALPHHASRRWRRWRGWGRWRCRRGWGRRCWRGGRRLVPRKPCWPVITRRHRNVQPYVSINEVACYRTERTLMVVLPSSPSKEAGAPQQCPPS